jgi:hypothetical protein
MNFTIEEVRQIIREVLLERKKNEKKKSADGRVLTKKYHGKEYKATPAGAKAAGEEDISAFKWADNPWAAKQAATIVKTGHPMVKKGKKHKSDKKED